MKTLLSIVLSFGLLLSAAHAQYADHARNLPADALKAKMYVVSERVLNLNRKEYTMTPGAVIYNENNLVVLTQSLTDTYIVRAQIDSQGDVRKVWILSKAEQEVDVPWLGGNPFWRRILPW